jgi:hypothetical protein
MCVLLYSLGKASFNMLAKLFDTWPSLTYRWIVEAGAKIPVAQIPGEVKEMKFDEMWHFIREKKTSFGPSRPLTAVHKSNTRHHTGRFTRRAKVVSKKEGMADVRALPYLSIK